jgi:hypothetical protein
MWGVSARIGNREEIITFVSVLNIIKNKESKK